MKSRKFGKRHRLLVYQRTMDRIWAATLLLGLLLVAAWWWAGDIFPLLDQPYDTVLIVAGLMLVALGCLFFLMLRFLRDTSE